MMDERKRIFRICRTLIAAILLAVSGIAVDCAAAGADELPAFRRGMWKFERTVGGRPLKSTKCANPSEDMKKQNEVLKKSGCQFSPVKKTGNKYTFRADCTIKAPSGAEIRSSTTTVITAESDSAYTLEVHGKTDGQETKERLVAKRVGDCP